MGVPGLWEVIQPVGQSRSLMNIAVVDGFERNTSGRRAYRVGIDTSIWFTHSYYSKGGENPQLRLLFFRLAKLAELPLLPLFVFDGRERPKVKRGSRMGKSGSHGLTDAFKQMLGHFGFEWRVAYGEAEAELARLNQIGIIDAILTDDVDTFIFGARVVIKNWSKELSGNKSKPATDADGKVSKHHVMVFNADDIRTHPSIGLTRGGLILFALLKGGDYDVGVPGIGEKIAHGLARAGFGDQLLTAFERRAQQPIQPFLAQWRADITTELRTNSRGLLPHRCTSVTIPVSFPDLQVLENYAAPRISPQGGGPLRDRSSLHVPRIARFCEDSFEWGYRSKILYRLRSVLWEACVMRVLRRAALEADEKEKTRRIAAGGEPGQAIRGALTPAREDTVGTSAGILSMHLDLEPTASSSNTEFGNAIEERRRAAFPGSSGLAAAQNTARAAPVPTVPKDDPLLVEIVSTRQHASTDRLLEYHVVLKPGPLVALANSGITGKRPEPSDAQKGKEHEVDPLGETRMWVPAPMMRQVHPDLVEDYETSLREKGNKRGRPASQEETDEEDMIEPLAPAPKRRRAPRKSKANDNDLPSSQGSSAVAPGSSHTTEVHRPPPTDNAPVASRAASAAAVSGSSQRTGAHMTAPKNNAPVPSRSAWANPGFLLWFADSDDPDMLEPGDDGGDTPYVPDRFDMLFDQMIALDRQLALVASTGIGDADFTPTLASAPVIMPQAAQISSRKDKGQATGPAPALANPDSVALDDPSKPFNQMFEEIMATGRQRAAAPRKPRQSASSATVAVGIARTAGPTASSSSAVSAMQPRPTRDAASDQFGTFDNPSDPFNRIFEQVMAVGAGKKRKKARQSAPTAASSASSKPSRGMKRKSAIAATSSSSFPDLLPLEAQVARTLDSPPQVSSARSDCDFIEIMSDSDDESSAPSSANGQARSQNRYRTASSSQGSGLSAYDSEVEIDLTL